MQLITWNKVKFNLFIEIWFVENIGSFGMRELVRDI